MIKKKKTENNLRLEASKLYSPPWRNSKNFFIVLKKSNKTVKLFFKLKLFWGG